MSAMCFMMAGNVLMRFYPGCYWLIGHTGGHRGQEIGPIPPHQSYLGFSQTETKREVRSGVGDTHKRNH